MVTSTSDIVFFTHCVPGLLHDNSPVKSPCQLPTILHDYHIAYKDSNRSTRESEIIIFHFSRQKEAWFFCNYTSRQTWCNGV